MTLRAGVFLIAVFLIAAYLAWMSGSRVDGRWVVGGVAVVFALVAATALLRTRRPSYAVLLLQLLAVPLFAVAAYVASPPPTPRLEVVYRLALVVSAAVVAFGVIGLGFRFTIRRRRTLRLEDFDRAAVVALAARALILLVITAVLAVFEPWFAIAGLALNAAWVAWWLPARRRRVDYETEVEVRAPAERVFGFMTEPANWPQFRDDVSPEDVRPPAPLAVGTTYTTRQSLTPKAKPGRGRWLESEFLVSEVSPERSFTVAAAGRPAESSRISFEPVPEGTRVRVRNHAVVALRYAIAGDLLDAIKALPERRRQAEARHARMKAAIEAAPVPAPA